jgi:glycosyltransferase involved in cell wall biosynthesis
MKILFVTNSLESAGGQERQTVELLKGYVKKPNLDIEVVLFSKKIFYTEIYDFGINIHFIIQKFRKDPTILFKLYKLCLKIKPDIIHTWGPTSPCYLFIISKLLGIKFINEYIQNAPPRIRIFDKNWFRTKITFPFSDLIVANSKAGLDAYKVSNKKSTYIYNGFDFSRTNNLDDKRLIKNKFGINTKYVIGMVGSFQDRKDYHTYIEAGNKILNLRKDVTFLSVGSGHNLKYCKLLVKQLNKNYIKFLGSQKDVESIINICDICVLSTNYDIHGEGIANVIGEYMMLSKPVIATDAGGTKEIVIDGKSGYLIKNGDVEEMAEKIIILLNNSELRDKMGEWGRNNIRKNFGFKRLVDKHYELYLKLTNNQQILKDDN